MTAPTLPDLPAAPAVEPPQVGRIEVPEGYLDYDDFIERCCHILKRPAGMTSSSSLSATWTICGLSLRRKPHASGDTNAYTCPTCERPRCPDCVQRYQRGAR